MAQRTQKSARSTNTLPPQLAAVTLHAAGLDIGAAAHWVAVPPRDDPQPVRGFGAYTADLAALADWLATCGITTIALESTGVYWIPLFALLETRGFAVLLVDPQQGQKSKGRPKSDRHDCQWRQRLHTFGLLAGAFRPVDQVCVRRSSLRQRAMLLTYAAPHIQHMQKALTQMHLKLPHVVSDMTGVTGLAIIRALLAGERDPEQLAQRRDSRCKHDEATIARALQGNGREEHLCRPRPGAGPVRVFPPPDPRLRYQQSTPRCRRAPTAVRGSRCHQPRGRGNRVGTRRRSPSGNLCTASRGWT